MINEFESMKYSFFKEINSFKKQLLKRSETDLTRIQTQTDNINISSILQKTKYFATTRPSFYFKTEIISSPQIQLFFGYFVCLNE